MELLHGVATILDVLEQVLREHGRLFPLQQVGQMSSEKLGLVIGELAEHLVNRPEVLDLLHVSARHCRVCHA